MKTDQLVKDKKRNRRKNEDNFIQPPPLDAEHVSGDRRSQKEFIKQKDVRENNEGDGVEPERRSQLYSPKHDDEVVSEDFNDTKKGEKNKNK